MKKEIRKIIESKGLKDVSIEIVEKVLDNELQNETLKNIPILKSIIAIRNSYKSITDILFIKKAMHVLLELGEINWIQRLELVDALDNDDSSGIEQILMAINHLETIDKCKVYGRLCRLKATKKIAMDEFLRLTKLIQDSYLEDLFLAEEFYSSKYSSSQLDFYYPLFKLGLVFQYHEQSNTEIIEKPQVRNYDYPPGPDDDEPKPEYYVSGGEVELYYGLTNLGETLIKYYYDLFLEHKT